MPGEGPGPALRLGGGLADDLERWLRGEPITARRSGAWERARKWARRRPAATALIGVSLAAVLALTVMGWQVSRVRLQAALARAEEESRSREQEEKARIEVEAERDAKDRALTRAEGLRLIAQSEIARPINPGLALLLAIEGGRRHPGLLANNTLLAALEECAEEHTLLGHQGPVASAAYSPDGRRVVTAATDKTARIWDAATGRELLTLRGHEGPVGAAAFSPDGRRVVTIAEDHTARIWDATTDRELLQLKTSEGEQQHTLEYHLTARFSPDGRLVVTACEEYPDSTARPWDAATGQLIATLKGHEAPVVTARFSPDGRRVVTASWDKTARIWDALTGEALLTLGGHRCGLADARFCPDGRRILTMGSSGIFSAFNEPGSNGVGTTRGSDTIDDWPVRIWDAVSGRQLVGLKWPKGQRADVQTATFSPDGRHILTAGSRLQGQYVEITVGREVGRPEFGPSTPRLWDAATGEEVLRFQGISGDIRSAVFHPDGRRVAFVQGEHIRLSDAADGAELATLKGHTAPVTSAVFSPDGGHVLSAAMDHTARVWDGTADRTWEPSNSLVPPDRPGFSRKGRWRKPTDYPAFSPDGHRLASVRSSAVHIDDVMTGQTVALKGNFNNGNAFVILFSPDGSLLLTCSFDGTARVWDAATGNPLAVLEGFQTHSDQAASSGRPVFSPDGQRILARFRVPVSGRDLAEVLGAPQATDVDIWDARTGKKVLRLKGEKTFPVSYAGFSADGHRVFTAGFLGVRIWDADSGNLLTTITSPDPADHVNFGFLAISPDCRYVATQFGEKVFLWDGVSGKVLTTLQGDTSPDRDAFFSADGRRLISTSSDSAGIWDIPSGREIRRVKDLGGTIHDITFSPDGKLMAVAVGETSVRLWDAATFKELAVWKLPYERNNLSLRFTLDGGNLLLTGRRDAYRRPVGVLAGAEARKPRDLTPEERERFELDGSPARE